MIALLAASLARCVLRLSRRPMWHPNSDRRVSESMNSTPIVISTRDAVASSHRRAYICSCTLEHTIGALFPLRLPVSRS